MTRTRSVIGAVGVDVHAAACPPVHHKQTVTSSEDADLFHRFVPSLLDHGYVCALARALHSCQLWSWRPLLQAMEDCAAHYLKF
jgi:hypothetical protein